LFARRRICGFETNRNPAQSEAPLWGSDDVIYVLDYRVLDYVINDSN